MTNDLIKQKVRERIERDLRNEVGWLENGKPRGLDDAQISTILSIIEVNLVYENTK